MITRFFGRSRTVHFFITIIYLFILVFFQSYKFEWIDGTMSLLMLQLQIIVLLFLSLLLSSFIITKNKLTEKNNYPIVAFIVFALALFPNTISFNIVLANFFVLLGIRRAISLKSGKDELKKIFDSSLWITFGAVLFPPLLLFLLVVLLATFLYSFVNFRTIGVIIIGAAASVFASYMIEILIFNFIAFPEFIKEFLNGTIFIYIDHYNFIFNTPSRILLLLIMVIGLVVYFITFGFKSIENTKTFSIILVIFLISFAVSGVNVTEDMFICFLFPFLILASKIMELLKYKWVLDIVVILLIIINIIYFK